MLLEPVHIERSPPCTIETSIHEVFSKYYAVEAPEHVLVSVAGARLATNGLVVLPDGSLVGDVVTHMPEYRPGILASEPAYTEPLPPPARVVDGDAYSLVIGNAGNYFHWQQDVMMRLPMVLPLLPPRTRFIVPPGMQEFHRAMMSAVGVGQAELLVQPRGETWSFERLHFASPYLKPMLHDARVMQPFVDACLARYHGRERTRSRRIYISRRNAHHWEVTNESEVLSVLEPHGFEAHDLAQLCFEDQVRLFSEAEVVVGTGAGLSNVVFAPPGAKVVQIQDPAYPVGHHFTICRERGLGYWYLFADAVPRSHSQYGRGDLRVSAAALRASLAAMSL